MSAFLCESKTFDKIAGTLSFYADYKQHHVARTAHAASFILNIRVLDEDGNTKLYPTVEEQAAVFARRLYEMNLEAVNQRYSDGAFDDYGYKYRPTMPMHNKYALLKQIQCLTYQCSEGDVPETDLFKRLESIQRALALDIVTNTKEYEAAAWG